MTIIGIRFKKVGKIYYFDPGDEKFETGDSAVVETSRGVELGEVAMGNREVADETIVAPLKKVVRKAVPADFEKLANNQKREKEAFAICEKKIAQHKLDMKLVDVEYSFDNNKILFYFTADGRIDFRDLVKDLAGVFRTRIELRQIGVRDEAKMLGGLGICGRPFCCSEYMGDFAPVSIKMAKEQGLSLNPTKISGTCGRLMCCLKYEQAAYEDLTKKTPKAGSIVKTADGRGVVTAVDLLKSVLTVRLDGDEGAAAQHYPAADVTVIREAGRKAENKEPKDSDLPED